MRALLLAVASLVPASPCQQILGNLNPFTEDPGSAPGPFVPFGGGVVFAATTASTGRELWLLSAGSAAATLIADLAPGPASADPEHVVHAGNALFFAADDGTGQALWVSDGTGFGTRPLRALRFATAPPTRPIIAAGSSVFALADDGLSGPELWHSDGTAAGTRLVRELEAGAGGCDLVGATLLGNELVLAVRTPHAAPARTLLVRSDGTAAATTVFARTDQGGPDVAPPLVAAGGRVFFGGSPPGAADFELWGTDGTGNGTRLVVDLDPTGRSYVGGMIPFRNGVAFLARISSYGDEPIVSDGTPVGTFIVDVNRLVGRGSSPAHLTAMGGDLYLFGIGIAESGLFRIEGNQRAVSLVRTLSWRAASRSHMVAAGTRLFCRALDPAAQGRTAAELYVSDGTPAGTQALRDLRAGISDPGFDHLTVVGADVMFVADDGLLGAEPWRSDGTTAGTSVAANVHASATASGRGSAPTFFLRARLWTVFDADDGDRGREPFVTAGVPGDARRLADLVPGAEGSRLAPVGTTPAGALIASTPGVSPALSTSYWLTDGTEAGTRRTLPPLSLGAPVAGTIAPDGGGAVVFAAPWLLPSGAGIQGYVLLRFDGRDYAVLAPAANAPPHDVLVSEGRAFFAAPWRGDGYEPWTAAGQVVDLRPGPASSDAGAGFSVGLRGRWLFAAHDGVRGVELWSSDGTAAGTHLVADVAPGAASSNPRAPAVAGAFPTFVGDARVFFVADVPGLGAEPWVTDGSTAGTRLVADIWPGPTGSNPSGLAAQGGGVYFAADDGSAGRELWVSDGTASGTRRVSDVAPGPASSDPRAITALGSRRVLLVASDAAEGDEPWLSDGTVAGTRRLAALRPGPTGSGVVAFDVHPDGRVLFVANDGQSGAEPWTLDPGAVAVRVGRPCGAGDMVLQATDPVLGASAMLVGVHPAAPPAALLLLSRPLDVPFFGCSLLADPQEIAVPVPLMAGVLRLALSVPNAAGMIGLVLHAQAVAGPFPVPPGIALSNAVALRLGR